jgi:hypothetical protein
MNLKTGLISHWKLDETSGTRNDAHGTNHLTDNNTVTSSAGKLGNAGTFTSANNETLNIVDNAFLSIASTDFTISCWIKFTTLSNGESYQTIIAKDDSTSGNREYSLLYDTSANRLLAVGGRPATATVDVATANGFGALSSGTWYFVVMWYDSVAQTINIQVNNGTVDSVAKTIGPPDTTQAFILGGFGNSQFFLNGLIDSVSFWKRVLTSAERKALYNSGNGLGYSNFNSWDGTLNQDLIAHWKLNEGSGSRIDSHGSNDLTDNNTVGDGTGKLGAGAAFIAANSEYLSLADNPDLDTGDIDFCYSVWVKMNVKGTHRPILQKSWDESYGEVLLFYSSSLDLFSAQMANGAAVVSANSLGIPSTGVWYHILLWYDSVNNTFNIQVNGGTVDSASYSGGNTTTTGTFKIGSAFGAYFDGVIDSVSYWKRVLTSAERKALYNSSNALDYESFNQWVGSLKHNLISHWKLEESSGTRLDAHGTNDLTDNNTVTSGTGKLGNAASFVAANDEFLSHTDNDELSTGDIDFTVACWVNFSSLAGTHGFLQKGMNDAYGEYLILYSPGPDTFIFYIADLTTSVTSNAVSFATNTWHFVVAWYDSVTNKLNIQIDNGVVSSTSFSGGNASSPGTFKIGKGVGNSHDGLVDSVSYWKRVLTSAERRALYNSGNGLDYESFSLWQNTIKQNLISHWKLNESSGTRFDAHADNDLTDNNTVTSTTGKIGQAAQFVRANTEFLNISTPEAFLQVQRESDWTVAFWFYPNTSSVTYRLLSWGSDCIIRFNNFGSGDQLETILGNFCHGPAVTAGQWSFGVVKWDANASTLSIRVNNGIASTFVDSGETGTGDFLISSDIDTVDGLMDSVSFWNRLLTSTEESTLYNSGAGLDYDFSIASAPFATIKFIGGRVSSGPSVVYVPRVRNL